MFAYTLGVRVEPIILDPKDLDSYFDNLVSPLGSVPAVKNTEPLKNNLTLGVGGNIRVNTVVAPTPKNPVDLSKNKRRDAVKGVKIYNEDIEEIVNYSEKYEV